MKDGFGPRPVAGWFVFAAIAALLFMALGCVSYLIHVFANPATMPLDQRAAYEAEPPWVTAAYAVAVWFGLIGALLLVLRRRVAERVLLGSLIATVIWVAGLFLVAPVRESMSTNDFVIVIVVAALTWTIYWFARHSRQRGWLA
jgi:hypothetical protein